MMIRRYYFPIVLFIAISGCKKDNVSNCRCNAIEYHDAYEYPIKPGSAEWNAAGSAGGTDSIYKISQVPPLVLQSMSTSGLIQTLEANPTLFNMFLRDNKFRGRDEVLFRLNVSWELNSRMDAGEKIIEYYDQKEPCCVKNFLNDISRGKFASDWHLFDMVCTQDSIINKMDIGKKKTFAKVVVSKYQEQLMYPDIFGSSKTTSVLILSNLMKAGNYAPYLDELSLNSELKIFSETGILTTNIRLDDIIQYATAFMNS